MFGNKKATMKLLTECVKLKKLMAANTNRLPINIECFMDDKDVSGHMDRAKFEELIASHLADIERVMGEVLTASKLKPEEIYRYTFIPSFAVCIFLQNTCFYQRGDCGRQHPHPRHQGAH